MGIERKRSSARVDVDFLDDVGWIAHVPGSRLRVLWRDVAAFDEEMANWDRIDFELTEPEQAAAWEMIEGLAPEALATCEWSPVRCATAIHDQPGLAEFLDVGHGTLDHAQELGESAPLLSPEVGWTGMELFTRNNFRLAMPGV